MIRVSTRSSFYLFLVIISLIVITQNPVLASNPNSSGIGIYEGYRYNQNIDIQDGLSEDIFNSIIFRSIARVEKIRGKEFKGNIAIERKTKARFRNKTDINSSKNRSKWNNQVWEALFIVGEKTDIKNEINRITKNRVKGIYSEEKINLIVEDKNNIDETILAHEIVHAFQDNYYNLSRNLKQQDKQLAWLSIVEGEAKYIIDIYKKKCNQTWSCINKRQSNIGSIDNSNINQGVYILLYYPYSDGPPYIHHIKESRGWFRIEKQFKNPPKTTKSIIHNKRYPKYNISFNDRSNSKWKLFKNQGKKGYDTAGEASIFSMFWYQSNVLEKNIIDTNNFWRSDSKRFNSFNYTSIPSKGWKADRIYPYKSESKLGYVWHTVWESKKDASEFKKAYIKILKGNGGKKQNNTWEIPDGRFEDFFKIYKDDNKVSIVNAPTRIDLNNIYTPKRNNKESKNSSPIKQDGFRMYQTLFILLCILILKKIK